MLPLICELALALRTQNLISVARKVCFKFFPGALECFRNVLKVSGHFWRFTKVVWKDSVSI